MSSQYSPDLRIELIGTGDQAGVWGATTNNNMAYVLEQAIAGYVSVAVNSTAQALTYLNGASSTAALNQSVHATIALTTGSVSADFFIYAPPNSKLYVIYNATSYTAKIRNSYPNIGDLATNGTGVDIPAGKVMTVWSDGTNFVQQNTHMISPTLATATLNSPTLTAPVLGTPASGVMTNVTGLPLTTGVTGTLPVANGGTGVTSSTGSGSNVLSNSPTLVTPALGTPSSVTLSNATGLPLTTGVTGTLPIANGGTGSTSTTYCSLATNVTGTLPVANGGTGVTSSTGSGSNVLSNSPTLVTPNLGTPSSLVGTNISGTAANLSIGGTAATATRAYGADRLYTPIYNTYRWEVFADSSDNLIFQFAGSNKAKLDSNGNLTVLGNITAYGNPSA